MAKFSNSKTNIQSVLGTTGEVTRTYEGAVGYKRDAKSALFLRAINNLVGEDKFYETAEKADAEYRRLIHEVTKEDPEWVLALIPYLRDVMNLRSASVVMAAEYIKAGGPSGRRAVNAAISRADEPAECLAYWASEYGRAFPKPLKRGVSDAASRVYNEKSALKYDGQSRGWRMGDVIDVTHARPVGERQSDLYKFLIDRRHDRELNIPRTLRTIRNYYNLMKVPVENRRDSQYLNPETLADAAFTWETLSGWLQGPMDKAAWEAIIPNMGYMALIRNLRNFEQAGVSKDILNQIEAKITDPTEVANSRQFPFRFYSAWKYSETMRFGQALEEAFELSTKNIPELNGNTLILVDVSGSMSGSYFSAKSKLTPLVAASLFGTTLAKRSANADLVLFATTWERFNPQASVLRSMEKIEQRAGYLGGGTNMFQALEATYRPGYHKRIVVLTDGQFFPHNFDVNSINIPVYNFMLAGYGQAGMQTGSHGRYDIGGGLTDATFTMLTELEKMHSVGWPFLANRQPEKTRKQLVTA